MYREGRLIFERDLEWFVLVKINSPVVYLFRDLTTILHVNVDALLRMKRKTAGIFPNATSFFCLFIQQPLYAVA
jgi:hypothetical protein